MKNAPPRGYQPIEGAPAYNKAVQDLLFGQGAALTADGRVVTAQALGGTGALKIGADFLKRLLPQARVYISDPSWENHRALFEAAGFEVDVYPYFDADTRGVRFDAMIAHLKALPANQIVLLHACCHNPTGADLTDAQWGEVVEVCKSRNLVPFLDMISSRNRPSRLRSLFCSMLRPISDDAGSTRASRKYACCSSRSFAA